MDKRNFSFEEIQGEVINIEEATFTQKIEKSNFKIIIATLCSAVVLGGISLYSHQQNNIEETSRKTVPIPSLIAQEVLRMDLDLQNNNKISQKDTIVVEKGVSLDTKISKDFDVNFDVIMEYVNSMSDEEFNKWINSGADTSEQQLEVTDQSPVTNDGLKVFLKFIKNGEEWIRQGLIFTSPDQKNPIDNPNEKYVLIGKSEKADDKVVVYEQQIRNFSIGDDWKSTGKYIIVNPLKEGYVPPINDITTRYVYLGTNSNSIHINAQLNQDENDNLFVTDITSQNNNNDLEGRNR